MKYLLDTNILLRLIEINHPQHKEAAEALKKLRRGGFLFYILLQNVSEFWNVCTRPIDKNGLGL
jgi:predicted nucleic acid-binding protein